MNRPMQRMRGWAGALIAGIFAAFTCLGATTSPPRTPDSASTPTERPEPAKKARHEAILASLKDLNPEVAFLGDSITERWDAAGVDVWKSYDKYHAANLGVGGDATEHVLWRITTGGELDTIHPKVVVLLIGTNNIGHKPPDKPEWAAAGVKKVIETVQAKLPDTKILLLAVFPRNAKDSPQRAAINGINDIIKTYADGDKVRYLDIGSVFLDANGEIPKDIMPEGLHPTAKGYALWRDAMQPTLDEMLK